MRRFWEYHSYEVIETKTWIINRPCVFNYGVNIEMIPKDSALRGWKQLGLRKF